MLRRLLALTLFLTYAPFLEAAEWSLHFATHGDFVHTTNPEHDSRDTDEHGCVPTFHICACHASPASTGRVEARGGIALAQLGAWAVAGSPVADRTPNPPPLRPPIS